MKLAIIGSRDFSNYKLLKAVLDRLIFGEDDIIVSGGADGADKLAERYARENNIKTLILKPDWNKYGRRAGFMRNTDIWDASTSGIAFWDGESKGTKHSFEISKKQNKTLLIVDYVNQKTYHAYKKVQK